MIIFNAGISPRPVVMAKKYHRLLSYYYVRTNKLEKREIRKFIKQERKDGKN